jgi:hypothetical protein
MTLAPSSPSSYLTAQDAISAIVAAEGNLDLAAERLFGFEEGTNSRAQLIALLAEDPTAHANLQRTLRTLSLMEAFATFKEVALSVRGTLDTLEPHARSRLLKQLLDSIAILTDDHTQNINSQSTRLNLSLTEAVYKSLPPDVQQALKVIEADTTTDLPADLNALLGAAATGVAPVHTPPSHVLGNGIPNAAEGTDI